VGKINKFNLKSYQYLYRHLLYRKLQPFFFSDINIRRNLAAFTAVLWFNSSRQLSTTQLLAHSPPSGMGERIGRVEVRKLVG